MSRISRSSSLTSRTAPLTRWESREWARLVLSELRPPSPTLSITLPENACVTFQLQSTRYSGDYLTLLALSGYSDCAPNVRFWHKADIPRLSSNVCFRG